jgi:hypothetical protein
MADLKPYKDKIMELSYEDKMIFSEWLKTEIDFERGAAIKDKIKQTSSSIDSFLQKAQDKTSGLSNMFKQAFGENTNNSSGPEKK